MIKTMPALKTAGSKFCAGCGHNIFNRLIAEVIEELGYVDQSYMCMAIGCTSNHNSDYLGCCINGPHGRPAAVATGIKRTNPEILTFTYQGDGDAYVIGLQETFNAAYRCENITQFVLNNSVFAMTGGQMGWTSLPGQVTITSRNGRDCSTTGYPLKMPELIVNSFKPAFVARGALFSPAEITKTKKYIRQALTAQLNGEGYSLVEVLSICPTNWYMTEQESVEYLKEKMVPVFPLGILKDREVQA